MQLYRKKTVLSVKTVDQRLATTKDLVEWHTYQTSVRFPLELMSMRRLADELLRSKPYIQRCGVPSRRA